MFNFEIIKNDNKSKARVGRITTSHGVIDTPCFIPVGTKASVKSLTPQDLEEIGVQILFGNTYHLHLSPGEDTIQGFGGLGKFMGWNGPTITDSGGFQVFSLGRKDKRKVRFGESDEISDLVKITEDGVVFRSYIDGTIHEFIPEKSIEIQKKLKADIILAFDDCTPYPATHEQTKKSMERTHKWSIRCLEYHKNSNPSTSLRASIENENLKQALYGIVQGGTYEDLRKKSASFISGLPFDGIAIGGVSVGESKKEMRDVLKWTVPLLPDDKPRHLLGVGKVDDIFDLVEAGMDTFDCVIPTRIARTGFIFVSPPEGNPGNEFRIDIEKSKYGKEKNPLDKNCGCYVCRNFSRGYIHHLFKVRELLAYRLASYHNVYFIVHLTNKIREAILEDRFHLLKRDWLR